VREKSSLIFKSDTFWSFASRICRWNYKAIIDLKIVKNIAIRLKRLVPLRAMYLLMILACFTSKFWVNQTGLQNQTCELHLKLKGLSNICREIGYLFLNVNKNMMSLRGHSRWAKMMSLGGKLTVLACHPTKNVNKAE
jgi:hypothetical protein